MHSPHPRKLIIVIAMIFLFFGFRTPAQALQEGPPTFPRLSNYFLRAGTDLAPDLIPLLARYDLLILPVETQIYNKDIFQKLRARNPDIIILAYLATISYNFEFWRDPLHKTLLQGIHDDWWLREPNGASLSIWPGTKALNLTTGWAPYLAEFAKNQVMASRLWDGIFFDEVGECIVCGTLRAVDLNHDGITDHLNAADAAWRQGTRTLLEETRAALGARAIIITNGSSTPEYQPYVNGRMFESFPTPWEADGSWAAIMRQYLDLADQVGANPPILVLDGDTENTGLATNYRDVRFGLASALLGNGYFGYSSGTKDHGQLWWYDEYGVYLGKPNGPPIGLNQNVDITTNTGLWQRNFEKGVVLVNATQNTKTIALDRDFEKIHGTQDPATNDGGIVQEVELPPQDGVILLRLVERIQNLTFPNGSFARILKSTGEVARTGLFLSEEQFEGGSEILRTDLNQDGNSEIIVANNGTVSVWGMTESASLATWNPYGPAWRGEIHIAVGDTDGDGWKEIITAPGKGGGPHVRVFSRNGRLLSPGFFAFEETYRGGVSVALGDLDPKTPGEEIVLGRGSGGRPEVRVFRANGTMTQKGFDAYGSNFRGGTYVAAGDVDGDGVVEIITGAGRGGGPHVRIFSPDGTPEGRGFFPYQKSRRTGVRVGTADLDSNGLAEIFAMTPELD